MVNCWYFLSWVMVMVLLEERPFVTTAMALWLVLVNPSVYKNAMVLVLKTQFPVSRLAFTNFGIRNKFQQAQRNYRQTNHAKTGSSRVERSQVNFGLC